MDLERRDQYKKYKKWKRKYKSVGGSRSRSRSDDGSSAAAASSSPSTPSSGAAAAAPSSPSSGVAAAAAAAVPSSALVVLPAAGGVATPPVLTSQNTLMSWHTNIVSCMQQARAQPGGFADAINQIDPASQEQTIAVAQWFQWYCLERCRTNSNWLEFMHAVIQKVRGTAIFMDATMRAILLDPSDGYGQILACIVTTLPDGVGLDAMKETLRNQLYALYIQASNVDRPFSERG